MFLRLQPIVALRGPKNLPANRPVKSNPSLLYKYVWQDIILKGGGGVIYSIHVEMKICFRIIDEIEIGNTLSRTA